MDTTAIDTSFLEQFSVLDIVAVLYLVYGGIQGFRRGLSGEIAQALTLVVALLSGWLLYLQAGAKIAEATRLTEQHAALAGFVCTFGFAWLVMFILRLAMKAISEFSFKGELEQVGGVMAGLVRCLAVITVVVMVLGQTGLDYLTRKVTEESRIGSAVYRTLVPVYERLRDDGPEGTIDRIVDPGTPEDEDPEEDTPQKETDI